MIREAIWMLKYFRRKLAVKTIAYKTLHGLRVWKKYWSDYCRYRDLDPGHGMHLIENLYPCLGDSTAETLIEPIYFYQDAWAFGKITHRNPARHVDIGSHHKFVSLLSTVIPLVMVDLRPLSLQLDTIEFMKGSILDLPFEDESVESVSCLCVIEHIGLGRYGDPLDPCGTEKAIAELKRIVKPGGNLYLSLPVEDENKIYFNAHRLLAETYADGLFSPLTILEKKYIQRRKLVSEREKGVFCIGLYHLQKS